MNVDVVHNEVTKIVIIEERLEPVGSYSPSDQKALVVGIAFGVVGGIVLILVLLCLFRRKRRKSRKKAELSSNSTTTTSTPPVYNISTEVQLRSPEDVARRYERSISSFSTKSQIYLVPFGALPPDFDFSSREVEVKADYVILKDLKLLDRNHSSNNGGVINEAYEPQEPFNPYLNGPIPPLIQEPYKKQAPYNPSFY